MRYRTGERRLCFHHIWLAGTVPPSADVRAGLRSCRVHAWRWPLPCAASRSARTPRMRPMQELRHSRPRLVSPAALQARAAARLRHPTTASASTCRSKTRASYRTSRSRRGLIISSMCILCHTLVHTQAFKRDGYLVVPDVLTSAEVEEIFMDIHRGSVPYRLAWSWEKVWRSCVELARNNKPCRGESFKGLIRGRWPGAGDRLGLRARGGLRSLCSLRPRAVWLCSCCNNKKSQGQTHRHQF